MIAPLLGRRSCPAALPEEEAQGNHIAWKGATGIAESRHGAELDILIARNVRNRARSTWEWYNV
jgi:hypothetical protein